MENSGSLRKRKGGALRGDENTTLYEIKRQNK